MIEKSKSEMSLKNCTFVKTVLMLLVILGHSMAFWSGSWFTGNPEITSLSMNYLYKWINSFHVFAFALVSGYIFAFKVSGGGYSSYIPFLKNKVKRLLIPYVFTVIIWVAPLSQLFFQWSRCEIFEKYVLCTNPSQLWFLWMLFWVFVISQPLRKVFVYGNNLIGTLLAIFFYGIGIIGESFFPNIFCIWTGFQFIPFFYIGIRIRKNQEKEKNSIAGNKLWWCWIIVDIMLYLLYVYIDSIHMRSITGKILNVGIVFILHIVGAVMAYKVLQYIAEKVDWKNNRMFISLSLYSMPMYLFHQQIIYFTIVLLNGKMIPWINAGVNFLVSLIVSYLISCILMKFKVTRLLVGEK